MRKIIFFAILIFCLFASLNSVQAILSLWKKQTLLVKTQKQLIKQEQENKTLTQELSVVKSQEFVESEARNKLFMVKPGEDTVIIAKNLLSTESAKQETSKQLSNWEQWWNLFF